MNARTLVTTYLGNRLVETFNEGNLTQADHLDGLLVVIEGMKDDEFQNLEQENTVTL